MYQRVLNLYMLKFVYFGHKLSVICVHRRCPARLSPNILLIVIKGMWSNRNNVIQFRVTINVLTPPFNFPIELRGCSQFFMDLCRYSPSQCRYFLVHRSQQKVVMNTLLVPTDQLRCNTLHIQENRLSDQHVLGSVLTNTNFANDAELEVATLHGLPSNRRIPVPLRAKIGVPHIWIHFYLELIGEESPNRVEDRGVRCRVTAFGAAVRYV